MKYKKLFLFSALSALTLSCNKGLESTQPRTEDGITEINATFAKTDTRTVLSDDKYSILWSPSDEISVFYNTVGVKFTSLNTVPLDKTIFASSQTLIFGGSETAEKSYIYGIYPYSVDNAQEGEELTLTVPSTQTAVEGSFARGAYPSVGRSQDTNMAFYNVCGGVCFSLTQSDVQYVTFEGNNQEYLAGRAKVTFDSNGIPEVTEVITGAKSIRLNAPTSSGFTVGKLYYFSVLPQTLSNGFTMTFRKGSKYAVKTSSSSVAVKRSVFGKMESVDEGLEYKGVIIDLSASGTANCYIVSEGGDYKFKATVKGGSTESVGTPASASVLWESFGTGTTPTTGDIVKSVSLDAGYAKFSTPETLNDGNAVIAVKDASGNILWSWHIWVCKDFNPISTFQIYNNSAGTMMDRNLGATTAAKGDVKTLGLLYQWGRKDPFLSSSSISSVSSVASTLSWPVAETVSEHLENNNTLSYSVAHPTVFLKNASSPKDWYCISSTYKNDDLWSSEKSIYDPCPTGWRVPDGGSGGVWSKAFGSGSDFSNGPWDKTDCGMNFGSGNGQSSGHQLGSSTTIWYPAPGYRYFDDGIVYQTGSFGRYWSCTPIDDKAYDLYFYNVGYVAPSYLNDFRASACAVRCVSE